MGFKRLPGVRIGFAPELFLTRKRGVQKAGTLLLRENAVGRECLAGMHTVAAPECTPKVSSPARPTHQYSQSKGLDKGTIFSRKTQASCDAGERAGGIISQLVDSAAKAERSHGPSDSASRSV